MNARRLGMAASMGAAVWCGGGGTGALAGPITPGNVLLYRAGDGTTSLADAGDAVHIDEYTPGGVLVQSIALPSSGTGVKLTCCGHEETEGLLTVSPNGRWVALTGYNSVIGNTINLHSASSATMNRVAAVIDVNTGAISLRAFSDVSSGKPVCSAVTDDGTRVWMTGGAGGVRLGLMGAGVGTSTQLSTTITDMRQVEIANGRLMVSSSAGGGIRVGTVGAGVPTTSGQVIASLPGFPTSGSPYAFYMADLSGAVAGADTLYVADDSSLALRKYALVGGVWTLKGTVGSNSDDYRSVTGVASGSTVTLFAVRLAGTSTTGGGELVRLTDATGYNGAFSGTPTVLATAPTKVAYRGVVVVQVSPGACCDPGTGMCSITLGAGACSDAGGTFQGSAIACESVSCPPPPAGVCCFDTGACEVRPASACPGDFNASLTTCVVNPCPQPGVCCMATGDCVVGLQAACGSGMWTLAGACATAMCPQPLMTKVELAGASAGTFTRCITFGLYGPGSCPGPAYTAPVVMSFVGRTGTGVVMVPAGTYTAVTAEDRLHTLRRTADAAHFSVMGKALVASFVDSSATHAPDAPGNNALVGGNLNGDDHVDVFDFAVLTTQIGTSVGASTTCSTAGFHADINGDGLVDVADFVFISASFFRVRDVDPCGGALVGSQPVLDVSVLEMAAMPGGWEMARRADVNRDGRVNAEDVGMVGALLNGGSCAGDYDHDGAVTVRDVFAFIGNWFAGYPGADVDDDGALTVRDVFAFLAEWFATCP